MILMLKVEKVKVTVLQAEKFALQSASWATTAFWVLLILHALSTLHIGIKIVFRY